MRQQKPRHSKPFSKGPKARPQRRPRLADDDQVLIFGVHAAEAALTNRDRPVFRVHATKNAAHRLKDVLAARGLTPEPVTPKDLDKRLGPDTVHQGVLLEAGPLPPRDLADIDPAGIVLVLDQVTDPHNVGAGLRSAAAFGAAALIMTERHSPPLTGVLAKAASGALDLVPIVLVRNLAQALSELGERGVMRVGLAEEADEALEEVPLTRPLALVLGAEGKGLRQLTRETCDRLCRISTASALASLNVSNAAAIALHWSRLKTAVGSA